MISQNSEFHSQYFASEFRTCFRQIFHNLLNSDNLEIDRLIIRKILSFVFMYGAKKSDNSELRNFL